MKQLAYYANNVNKDNQKEFGRLLDKAVEEAGLKKKKLAETADIHPTSLSRIISGDIGVARSTAIALVKAANSLAGREIIDQTEALNLAGYSDKEAESLPEPLRISDFDGFDADDISEIKKYIEFRKSLKKKQE